MLYTFIVIAIIRDKLLKELIHIGFNIILCDQVFGCLIYLCNPWPHIQYNVSRVRKFMHSPRTKHKQVVKHIFGCLKGNMHFDLFSNLEGGMDFLCWHILFQIGIMITTHRIPH